MVEIEKLTPEARVALARIDDGSLALRIIEQQAVEIVRLSEELAQLRQRVAEALDALDATRFNPSGSLVEWALSPEGRNLGYVTAALNALRKIARPHRELRNVTIDVMGFDVGMSWFDEWMQNRTPDLLVLVGDNGTRQLLPPGVEQPVGLVSNTSYRIVRPVQTQAAPTPDYRSDVERCSCEEALGLREELGAASRELKQLADRVDNAEQRVAEQRERIRQDCIAAEERAAEVAALRAERQERESTVLDYAKECADLRAEVERLRAQLPIQMPNCSILFKECPVGHGWLTATNWVDSGCIACQLNTANALVSEVLDTPSVTLVDWVAWGKRARAHLSGQAPTRCDHAGAELAIDRATGEERCGDCGEPAAPLSPTWPAEWSQPAAQSAPERPLGIRDFPASEYLFPIHPAAEQAKEEFLTELRAQLDALAPGEVEAWVKGKAAEQRVLEAMAQIPRGVLECVRDGTSFLPPVVHAPCMAELARREAK